MFKKKCELLFEDSLPSGRIVCGLSNWDGICLRIPKSRLSNSSSITCIQNTGVYFLTGEKDGKNLIYIGEAENVFSRLKQHLAEDTWQEAYVVTRKDNSLNKALVKYLENAFYETVSKVERYEVTNKTVPTKSSISIFDIEDMREFQHYSIMLIELLGCKAFTESRLKQSAFEDLYIDSIGIKARGRMLDDEFIILKGSQSNAEFKKASDKNLKAKWQGLRDEGVVKNNVFVKDYPCPSPSTAAAMVLGRNASGPKEWKTKNKRKLEDLLIDR